LRATTSQPLLVYAPTFRDDECDSSAALSARERFNASELPERLRDGCAILARVRLHLAKSRDSTGRHTRRHYLAGHVLIAHYSAVTLHFGVTGEPMILCVQDLGGAIQQTTASPHERSARYNPFRTTCSGLDDGPAAAFASHGSSQLGAPGFDRIGEPRRVTHGARHA
jgi:hypothetical protein